MSGISYLLDRRAVALFIVIGLVLPSSGMSNAADVTHECRGVQKVAMITLSTKLIFSYASDATKQTCAFFVSLPPPFATRDSVGAWFKASKALLDSKVLTSVVADLAIAPMKDNPDLIKAVQTEIYDNTDLVTSCVVKLFDRQPFGGKSKDGRMTCDSSPTLLQAIVQVSVGDTFSSVVALPLPLASS